MSKRNPVAHALNHWLRKRIVEILWHTHEPLSAVHFHREFLADNRIGLDQVVYHVRQLDKDGIIKLDVDQDQGVEGHSFVLAGPNSSEAIRTLELTPDDLTR